MKISKISAHYQPLPKRNKRCLGCSMWLGNGECSKVYGEIRPGGWCRLWESK